MELPQVVERFIETQQIYDSTAFAECFTESAIVHDEGKPIRAKKKFNSGSIMQWRSINPHWNRLIMSNLYQAASLQQMFPARFPAVLSC